MKNRPPTFEFPREHFLTLARIVAETSWLPDPETVRKMDGAIFPTFRNRNKRAQPIEDAGKIIGMYDDNATAHWALLWCHGILTKCPSGWSISHVWALKNDIKSFTHLANLVLIPECLAGLSDKRGPLTEYLRWHSWKIYGWKPDFAPELRCPEGYDDIKWRYFEKIDDPVKIIRDRINKLKNQRVRILRPIMKKFQ